MKSAIKNLFLLLALAAGLGLIPPGRVTAQTFTTLHSFTALSYGFPGQTNSDGANPYTGLIISGSTLYGAALYGGSSGDGTVFKVNTDGTGFTNLHNFTAVSGPAFTNSDGAYPSGLILSGNTLYGTAKEGGSSGRGTVFAITTNGTGFTNLHSFAGGGDGYLPFAGLVSSGNTLYGTTGGGGAGFGMVFAVNTDGTGFTNLHSFDSSDGATPRSGLALSGSTLYGTTADGGSSDHGTVFKVTTDGTGFTNLHSFAGFPSDGASPFASLILSGNTLYGTAISGGGSDRGMVFSLATDGSGYTILHSFNYSGGAGSFARLTLSRNTLYGTTADGGSSGGGTVFAVTTNGTGFTNLHSFTGGSDGAGPHSDLILSGNTLYGTAGSGGSGNNGTVFSLSLPEPQLNIASVGNQSVLFWPASATNYILQSATNLSSPNWVTASDAVPVIAVTVTNTSPARFFRLISN